eukprot:TRINITY_DN11887_c0_g1_i2.p1 TRINITY_DN11887_c0_g1~~TRINITY_DN11887_c0_g1_i2.p1  ORF type:complete len:193 (+),score=55.56 TRINITY_DN11887_c0_g1_i2:409-987(+)
MALACVTDSLLDAEPRLPQLPAGGPASTGEWTPSGAGAARVVEQDRLDRLLDQHSSQLATLAGMSGEEEERLLKLFLGKYAGLPCIVTDTLQAFVNVYVHVPPAASMIGNRLWLPAEAVQPEAPPPVASPVQPTVTTQQPPSPPAGMSRAGSHVSFSRNVSVLAPPADADGRHAPPQDAGWYSPTRSRRYLG